MFVLEGWSRLIDQADPVCDRMMVGGCGRDCENESDPGETSPWMYSSSVSRAIVTLTENDSLIVIENKNVNGTDYPWILTGKETRISNANVSESNVEILILFHAVRNYASPPRVASDHSRTIP